MELDQIGRGFETRPARGNSGGMSYTRYACGVFTAMKFVPPKQFLAEGGLAAREVEEVVRVRELTLSNLFSLFQDAEAEFLRDVGRRPAHFLAGRWVLMNLSACSYNPYSRQVLPREIFNAAGPFAKHFAVLGLKVALDPDASHSWRVTAVPGEDLEYLDRTYFKDAEAGVTNAETAYNFQCGAERLARAMHDQERYEEAFRRAEGRAAVVDRALGAMWERCPDEQRRRYAALATDLLRRASVKR